jgi:hypothetical protein
MVTPGRDRGAVRRRIAVSIVPGRRERQQHVDDDVRGAPGPAEGRGFPRDRPAEVQVTLPETGGGHGDERRHVTVMRRRREADKETFRETAPPVPRQQAGERREAPDGLVAGPDPGVMPVRFLQAWRAAGGAPGGFEPRDRL